LTSPHRRRKPDRAAPRLSSRARPGADLGGQLGGQQVEGPHAVRELLAVRRRRVRDVWLADGAHGAWVDEIVATAAEARIPLHRVARRRLHAMAGTEAPQGVMAFADPVVAVDLAELVSPPVPRAPSSPPARPFLLILDGVTDPHNLGALLRTATCAGVTGVVVSRHRSARLGPAAVKAAAGAVEHIPLAVVPGVAAALGQLAAAGVWTLGLDADGEALLWEQPVMEGPVAVVLGAEGRGLSRLVRQRCDLLVRIPMPGPLPSLNVAAAGAVACLEVARRRAAAAQERLPPPPRFSATSTRRPPDAVK
jgi:23S rRNA (guanosine2251-2'-O)-methyltransferase